MSEPLIDDGWHVHVHKWENDDGSVGERRFEHAHPYPAEAADGARSHRHKNGTHSHPHDHTEYVP